MTGNVRKLALDVGLYWLLPIQILSALMVDYAYLQHPDLTSAFAAGVMLSLQATTSHGKIALWRTLPVTRREIGRARWWQMAGLPGIAIVVMMATAFALHAMLSALGVDHVPMRTDSAATLHSLLLQFFYPAFLTLFWLTVTLARTTGSPLAYASTVLIWAPYLLLLPHAVPFLPRETGLHILGLLGLIIAAGLYVTAPRWPLPITQPMQLDMGGGCRRITGSTAGRGGWFALCGMAVTRPALTVSAILVVYIGVIIALRLDRILVMQLELFTIVMVLLHITVFNSTGLRVLRTLPVSTLGLSAYLFLLPLALVAASICAFTIILEPWLIGGPPIVDVVALSAALLGSAMVLPAALAVRQAAMSAIILLGTALVAFIRFGWAFVPPAWHDERLLAGLAFLAICAGFFWMHIQISRGSKVYRLQPFVAARWRGKD